MCGPIRVSQLKGVLVGSGGEWKSPLSEPRITIKDDVIGMQADNTQADILADQHIQPGWIFKTTGFRRKQVWDTMHWAAWWLISRVSAGESSWF